MPFAVARVAMGRYTFGMRWRVAIAMGATACGPRPGDAERCVSRVELFDAPSRLVELADTTGNGVPEAWILTARIDATAGDGLLRDAIGRYSALPGFAVEGGFRGFADVDGDGRDDLVVEPKLDVEGNAWRVHGSDARGVPGDVIAEVYFGPVLSRGLAYLDVDGDERADFVGVDDSAGQIFVELSSGRRPVSQDEEIATSNARVLGIEPMWLVVTNGDEQAPRMDVLEVSDTALELRFRGDVPWAYAFAPAVARRSDGRISYFTAASRGGVVDPIRVDIDLDTGTATEIVIAEGAAEGRVADLDGDAHMDVAWIDGESRELRVRFGRADGELGVARAFPEIGALESLPHAADLDGSGAAELVVRTNIDEEWHRYEAITLGGCDLL